MDVPTYTKIFLLTIRFYSTSVQEKFSKFMEKVRITSTQRLDPLIEDSKKRNSSRKSGKKFFLLNRKSFNIYKCQTSQFSGE